MSGMEKYESIVNELVEEAENSDVESDIVVEERASDYLGGVDRNVMILKNSSYGVGDWEHFCRDKDDYTEVLEAMAYTSLLGDARSRIND